MLHDLPMGEPAFDIDAVYRYLVPLEYKSKLRAAGVIGGISAAVGISIAVHRFKNIWLMQDTASSYHRCASLFYTPMSDERSNAELRLSIERLPNGMDWSGWWLYRLVGTI